MSFTDIHRLVNEWESQGQCFGAMFWLFYDKCVGEQAICLLVT